MKKKMKKTFSLWLCVLLFAAPAFGGAGRFIL